jgi:hypothetical protein
MNNWIVEGEATAPTLRRGCDNNDRHRNQTPCHDQPLRQAADVSSVARVAAVLSRR